MFRKVTLGALLIVAFSFFALGFGLGQQMPLTLNIGSPAPTLIQNGVVTETIIVASGPVPWTLPVPSTAGTTLVAIVASTSSNTPAVSSFPVGWTKLLAKAETTISDYEVWAYIGNPGSITSGVANVTSGPSGARYFTHVSEWSNVVSVGYLEASGSASATSNTILAPTTGTNVLTAADVAISGWIQAIAASSTVTFTSPAGWTRLADTASLSRFQHLDIEYMLNPATGATLGPTLTSNTPTTSAAGVIVVLKAAPAIADQSPYLVYGSLSLKLNTLDFALVDCPTVMQNLATVTLSSPGEYPDWTGTVGQVQARDVVDIRSGHHFQVITATNTQSPNFTGAPFNLSDNPAANTADIWLLENGDTWALENGTGSWLMESSVQEDSYQGLSIGSQVGATSPAITLVTLGYLTTFRVGLWVGMTFKLTSSNLANWITSPGSLYTIGTITITYQGANPPQPVYAIQFSDAVPADTTTLSAPELVRRQIQTLADWTKAHAN